MISRVRIRVAARRYIVGVLVLAALVAASTRITGAATGASAGASAGGISIALGPVVRTSGCRVRGPLPDPVCTPGARFAAATSAVICRHGYARSVRNVPAAERADVYAAYGIRRHFNGSNGELDHLVPLELGGSNVAANLFPQAAAPRPGAHEKDRLENRLTELVCTHQVGLDAVQQMIATDWTAAARWVEQRLPGSSAPA